MGVMSWFRNSTSTQVATAPRRRGYAAAANIARYGDFRSSRGSADYELREGLAEVRAKVRFLARNSGSMKRYLQLLKVNVVGENGFRFQSRVRMLDGVTMNKALNAKVEAAWSEWCESPTVDRVMTMVDLQNQAVATWGRDGEIIWEIVTGPRYTHGIAVNPIEADQLDETLNTVHPATKNEIRMGVELNGDGAPVAYHFLTSHPGDITWFSYLTDKRYRRVPADRIIHIYERLRPGQTRGEPPAAAMVNDVKMLDGYREAETMGRRLRSALMGFFQRAMPNSQQLDELADHSVDDDGDGNDDLFEMNVEPGRFRQLPDGLEFKEFSPGGSQTDYAEFEQQVKKDISMGLGISTMSHGMEVEGISYSSGRTVVIEDRDYYKTIQGFFIRLGMVPLFRQWVVAVNLQDDAPFVPSQAKRVSVSCKFRARGWSWVDPSKDVKANAEALATMQTSLSRIAAERGIDRDELLDEIADDIAALKERGLTLAFNADKASEKDEPNDDNDKQP